MPTHIDTLIANTPKGRRRIRKALELPKGAPVTDQHAQRARVIARQREHTSRKLKAK
jgi:hypothetical protein